MRQFGQRLKAFVVLRDGAKLSEDDVKGYVKENLANYKVPREVVFLDELPRNPTGKVLKRRACRGRRRSERGQDAEAERRPARDDGVPAIRTTDAGRRTIGQAPEGCIDARRPCQKSGAQASLDASRGSRRIRPSFRAQFPVLERLAYLNAGTEGPVPAAPRPRPRTSGGSTSKPTAVAAGARTSRRSMELRGPGARRLRRVLGCDASEVALTGSTTDGVNTVLGGLDLRPGDEILTTDEEHPGLLAPLARARRRHGVTSAWCRSPSSPGAVSAATRLIACSHVSWVSGEVADVPALVATGVPVLLDAAQALGAVPVDVHALGCDFYAASGQKWLCGPEGSGCLYVRPDRLDELLVPWPGYGSLADARRCARIRSGRGRGPARPRLPGRAAQRLGTGLARVFEAAGWEWVHERAADPGGGAGRAAGRARARGAGRAGRSTLVVVEGRRRRGGGRAAGRRRA